jgi:RNA polymerase sigma factor (sigma-70 family)
VSRRDDSPAPRSPVARLAGCRSDGAWGGRPSDEPALLAHRYVLPTSALRAPYAPQPGFGHGFRHRRQAQRALFVRPPRSWWSYRAGGLRGYYAQHVARWRTSRWTVDTSPQLTPKSTKELAMSTTRIETAAATASEAGATSGVGGSEVDEALSIFLAQRLHLFRLAHRVTGDVATAEDVVQDAWLRWQRVDRSGVKNPAAFLTTTTAHLAINVIQSARRRHETPTEMPLPEVIDPSLGPSQHVDQVAAVAEVLFELMTKLSPAELAAYVLRKGFDYPYCDVAELLRTTCANARQLARRAQQRIEQEPRWDVEPEAYRMLVAAFMSAARTGRLADLEEVLVDAASPGPSRRVIPPRVA